MTDPISIHTQPYHERLIGPNIFVGKLFDELQGKGLVTLTDSKADLVFLYTKNEEAYRQHHPTVPVVTRCGGVWYRRDWLPPMEQRYMVSSGVVFQNNYCKSEYEKAFKKRDIPYAVALNGTDFKRASSLPQGVVCSAKWRDSKRPQMIIDVAKRMPHIDFTIIGDFPLSAPPNVTLAGLCTQSQVEENLHKGNVFLHTGLFDPCPNALIEARMVGLIPVASSSGGPPEIIKDSGFLYQEPASTDQIVEYVTKALDMPMPRERPDLSIEHSAKLYLTLFQEVLQAR